MITSKKPTRDNYSFVGWSTNSNANTPSFKRGDAIPASVFVGGSKTITLYAVWEQVGEKEVKLSNVVEVGDYVDFPVAYDNVNGDAYNGWRVISKNVDLDGNRSEGTVNLVSAGTPLAYYHANNSASSVTALTDNFLVTEFSETEDYTYRKKGFLPSQTLTQIFSNKYVAVKSDGTPAVRAMVADDIYNVTKSNAMQAEKSMDLSNPIYENLLVNESNYWIASQKDENKLWSIANDGYVEGYSNNEYGIRLVVQLNSEILANGVGRFEEWNMKRINYTVTYDVNGGKFTGENAETIQKSIKLNEAYGTLPKATREGHEFVGWFTDEGIQVFEDTIFTTENDQVISAKWEAIVYNIEYDLNNGNNGILSDGYTLLTYIESNGTQYIDTGFVPNQNTTVIMEFENNKNALAALFGARKDTKVDVFGTWIDSDNIYPHYGSISHNQYPITTSTVNNRLIYKMSKNVGIADGIISTSPTTTFSSTYTLALLAMNTASTYDSRRASGKLYSCQIYDNETLVRNYIPCINPNGEIGLYDTVNNNFYVNKGTGSFTAGYRILTTLPEDYTKLTYIESSGKEYIDTGFIPNQDTRVIIDYEHIGSGAISAMFGARQKTEEAVFGTWIEERAIFPQYGNLTFNKYPIEIATANNRFIYKMSKNVAIVNKEMSTSPVETFNSAGTLTLFAMHSNTLYDSRRAVGRIYSCQIYDNNTLVRYYIPCMNPNGEIGLYDTVNNKFYANAGGGEFAREETHINSYTINSDTITLPVIERDGYEFIGWTGSNGGTPQKVVTIEKGSTGHKKYTANWKAKKYNVIFEINDGKGTVEEKTVTYGETYGTLPTPKRTGYTFLGWYTEMFTGTLIESTTVVNTAKNHVIYAHWLDPELIFSNLDAFRTITAEDCEDYTEHGGGYEELYAGNGGEMEYTSDGAMKFDADNPILFLEIGENTDMFADEYSLYFTIEADTMQAGNDTSEEIYPATIASIGDGVNKYLAWIGIYKNYLHVYSYCGNLMKDMNKEHEEKGFISRDISKYTNTTLNIQIIAAKNAKTDVYLNGELFASFDSGGTDIETTHVTIGDLRPIRNLKYTGKLYDFAMYRRVLTQEEIITNWEFAKNKWINK